MAAKGACVYERALLWALEAEKLDLPHLSAQCERFIAMHWKQIHKYALRIENLSSPALRRIMMGMFHALETAQMCQQCKGSMFRCLTGISSYCKDCAGTGRFALTYPSVKAFMSWRTTPGGAS